MMTALQQAIAVRAARTALIKSDDAFEALYKELQDAMTRAWDEQLREALVAALDRLRELRNGPVLESDLKSVMATLETRAGGEAMRAALRGPILNLSDALYRTGMTEVGKSLGVDISFREKDAKAIDLVSNSNLFWVGNSWNAYTDKLFRSALTDYFDEGLTRVELTERFMRDFQTSEIGEGRGQVYWEMLADHTATKTREIGRVGGYEEAEISAVQVRAHIDDNTTEICRSLHGRIIRVSALREQVDGYLDAVSRRDMAGAKDSWTMHGSGASLPKDSPLPEGTGLPPYHFRCRTITVAYFD